MADATVVATSVVAVATVIYAGLVYKTLRETRNMAEATGTLARSSLRPTLVIEVKLVEGKHWHQIRNTGAGPAIGVEVIIGDKPVPDVPAVIPPGCITEHIEPLREAHGKRKVKMRCKDAQGKMPEGYPVSFAWNGREWATTKPE